MAWYNCPGACPRGPEMTIGPMRPQERGFARPYGAPGSSVISRPRTSCCLSDSNLRLGKVATDGRSHLSPSARSVYAATWEFHSACWYVVHGAVLSEVCRPRRPHPDSCRGLERSRMHHCAGPASRPGRPGTVPIASRCPRRAPR